MSEKMTHVDTGENAGSILLRGHVPYDEAITQLRRYLEQQRDAALTGLAKLAAGDVRVYHQRGIWVERDRREVLP